MSCLAQSMAATVTNHPFATGAAILGSTVVIYINNNHYINERVMSCAWTSMRIVSRLQMWYNDMFSKCWECWFFNQHASRFIYVIKEGKTVKAETLLNDHVLRYKKDYDFVIIQYPNSENTNKVVYKRYDEIPSSFTEEAPVKDLFFAINIKYGGKNYEIESVSSHTIPNTKIFDRSYTQWYMQFFHGLEIFDDDYLVEVLDGNMESTTFDHKKFILIANSSYTISDNLHTSTPVWRSILTEQDIAYNLPENKEVTLDDISSPPLIGKKCNNQLRPGTPKSNNTDISFDIVDESEAN